MNSQSKETLKGLWPHLRGVKLMVDIVDLNGVIYIPAGQKITKKRLKALVDSNKAWKFE